MSARRHPNRGQISPVVAVALSALAIVGIVAAVLVSRPASRTPTPSVTPSNLPVPASPSPEPTPTAVPNPSPSQPSGGDPSSPPIEPSTEPSDGIVRVPLENLSDHDVTAQVKDPNSILVGVRSGHPGDGMSVRWHDSIVENRDAETLVLTWVGLPQDEAVDITVDAIGGGVVWITILQTGPVPMSDALGEDRELVLTFTTPIRAGDVKVEIVDRTID
jgi:hypothetical protein